MSGRRFTDDIDHAAFCLVDFDDMDREIFDRIVAASPALQAALHDCAQLPVPLTPFPFECFCSFFKEEPYLLEESDWGPAAHRGRLLERLHAMPSYYRLAEQTMLDECGAATVTTHITQALLRAWGVLGDGSGDGDGSGEDDCASAFATALQQAAHDLQTLQQWTTGWGSDPGALTKLPVAEKLRIMERLRQCPTLHELSDLVGNAVATMTRKRATRVREDASELVDLQLGGPWERLLPSELAYLTRPRLRPLFHLRLAERTYTTYALDQRTTRDRGPLIVCIDTSGSMGGKRETWAKAVACALYTEARRQRRTFAYMHFSSATELRKVIVRRHDPGIEQLIDIATYAFGGGTDFDRPLAEALALIAEESTLRQADIVFISDGECAVSPWMRQKLAVAKQQYGCSVIGILIQESRASQQLTDIKKQVYAKYGLTPSAWLEQDLKYVPEGLESFCDHIFHIRDLTAKGMEPIFDPIMHLS
ncbi:VWA domain-containing protein [Candidatus Uhrbacteria bacterium]|nr:VWA domain-containing protein [Candidatus Uhrbacteria bacterium]